MVSLLGRHPGIRWEQQPLSGSSLIQSSLSLLHRWHGATETTVEAETIRSKRVPGPTHGSQGPVPASGMVKTRTSGPAQSVTSSPLGSETWLGQRSTRRPLFLSTVPQESSCLSSSEPLGRDSAQGVRDPPGSSAGLETSRKPSKGVRVQQRHKVVGASLQSMEDGQGASAAPRHFQGLQAQGRSRLLGGCGPPVRHRCSDIHPAALGGSDVKRAPDLL